MSAGIGVLIIGLIIIFFAVFYGIRIWNYIQMRGISRGEKVLIAFIIIVLLILYFGK